jgi:hypothetical protein
MSTTSAGLARRRLVDVARGEREPDLVIEGAQVFGAFTREWLDVDVAIADGRIAGLGRYDGGQRIDGGGRWLVPGFVDAHVHIESSKLMVDEFARALLAHGTTGEVYNVCSGRGVSIADAIAMFGQIAGIAPPIRTDAELVRPVENAIVVGSYAKLERAVGWRPRHALEDSLRAVYDYWYINTP